MLEWIGGGRILPGRAGVPERFAALPAGISGCLLLVVASSPGYSNGLPPLIAVPGHPEYHGIGWAYLGVPIAATVAGLCTTRWWPYQLVAAGLLFIPQTFAEAALATLPRTMMVAGTAALPLAVVGVLACAQGLARDASGLAAMVAGLTMGARLFGTAMAGQAWRISPTAIGTWHGLLVFAALLGIVPSAIALRRGDPGATGSPGDSPWWRARVVVTAALALCVVIPLSFLTTERMAGLLGVPGFSLYRHGTVQIAVVGVITVSIVSVLAAIAGPWSLAGALTAAMAQVAVAAPMILGVVALASMDPQRWLAVLAGAVAGAIAARHRWRIPLAAALAVLAATGFFTTYAATTGHPEKLAEQRLVLPAVLLLILISAAAVAIIGATAAVLAPQGVLPTAIGPLAAVLAGGGLQTVQVTHLLDPVPRSSSVNTAYHLNTSAVLLLVAAAAVGGLGLAQQFAKRRAERLRMAQVRREAADAERDRLARPIHDGVLQLLALVQRHGPQLGEQGSRLATLAGEQEVALRNLLTGRVETGEQDKDLREPLRALASPPIEVSTPAEPVVLPAATVAELTAAVQAALDNVRRHAGLGARAWVLVEDEQDGVRVAIRDDGVGFDPQRLEEAAEAGRLGVAQSMRGRIADLGGTTTIYSRLGEGTEVEYWIPR